ncbi:flavin reductase family protein [Aromatoleum bremense]|uniref:Flavin reductase n=1 Tax=Aromatoleum bremense TaxID=76115 RepID=A0ABX1NUT3_9RHOO|nr:flavin reductase family protein [Aromatoleum bremense]NMG15774.1 flavin reductase [Aromatoleum bremense]QTQ30019.1 Flavin reductase family protein [Aromatoleum bremense]
MNAIATPAVSAPQTTSDGRELRHAFGQFATGVTVITARAADGRAIGLTANSFSSLSLDPPLILWSLVQRSPNLQAFLDASHFAVNVLREDQEATARQFATPLLDKFDGITWQPGADGAPLLAHSLAQFECHMVRSHEGGDHVIFIGHVERFRRFSGRPLLFHGGAFQQIASEEQACA